MLPINPPLLLTMVGSIRLSSWTSKLAPPLSSVHSKETLKKNTLDHHGGRVVMQLPNWLWWPMRPYSQSTRAEQDDDHDRKQWWSTTTHKRRPQQALSNSHGLLFTALMAMTAAPMAQNITTLDNHDTMMMGHHIQPCRRCTHVHVQYQWETKKWILFNMLVKIMFSQQKTKMFAIFLQKTNWLLHTDLKIVYCVVQNGGCGGIAMLNDTVVMCLYCCHFLQRQSTALLANKVSCIDIYMIKYIV